MKYIRLMMAAALAMAMSFTAEAAKTAKAVITDGGKTLKFVYDDVPPSGAKGTDWFSVSEADEAMWEAPQLCKPWCPYYHSALVLEGVETIVIDDSFADYTPRDCGSWFSTFPALKAVQGIRNLNLSQAQTVEGLFSGCTGLEEIDLCGLDMSHITSTHYMFFGCKKLRTIVADFDLSSVTMMDNMFDSCESLERISVTSAFKMPDVNPSWNAVFFWCTNLVGGAGTAYNGAWTSGLYARIDGGVSAPGYFTVQDAPKPPLLAKAVVEDGGKTLRFVYDSVDYDSQGKTWYSLADYEETASSVNPEWHAHCGTVTNAVFDPSFAVCKPKKCDSWFYEFTQLVGVEGLENLDTSETTSFVSMFDSCSSLTSLDLSRLDTAKVADMCWMFWNCQSLTQLNLSGFDTAKVTDMEGMFEGCSSLVTLDVTSFDTANVKYMAYMFNGCSSLTTLDVTSFDTANVTDMKYMFCGCSSLTTLDVTSFDTANVTRMGHMFDECSSLTTLDVSGFDTANVTDMECMFYGCSSLEAICASDRFVTDQVSYSSSMFKNCSKLVGGAGTAYDSTKTDKTYARIDGEGGQPGYFTRGYAAKGVAGEYGKWTLPDLGIEPPAAGTVYAVKAYGLPSGLKLKYNAAKKDKKGKVIVKAKTDWWIEGVPTAALNALERPMYLAVTVGKKTTWYPVAFAVGAQKVADLGTFTVGTAFNETGWLPGLAGGGWSVSGLPKGLKYTANIVYKDPKKKSKGIKYAADTTYGKLSAAGLYTITAKKKKGGFYETLKFRVLVNPAGEFTTRNFTAYETFATMKDTSWKAVSGLPAGLKFTAKKYTVSGKPTKAGTFAVTFTDKNGKKTTEMWNVAANPEGPTLGFNTTGETAMEVTQGQKGVKNELAFAADGTVSASGLPKGMKLVKRTDPETGVVSYALGGVPSVTGTYFVTVKAAKNGQTVTQRVAVTVKANPMAGTYYGCSIDKAFRYRTASLSVAASGKATMKYTEGSKTYTLTTTAGKLERDVDEDLYVYTFVQKANTKKKIPARTVMAYLGLNELGATIGEWSACTGTTWSSDAMLCEGDLYKALSAAMVNAVRTDPETGFAAKSMYLLTSEADPAEVIYATSAYSSKTGKFTVKGKLPRGKAFSATVSATSSGRLELTPISAADADGTRYLLMLRPGGGGEVVVDGLMPSEFKIDLRRYDFGTGYTALPTTFAAAIANTVTNFMPVGVTYPKKGDPATNEKEVFFIRANGSKYFQVSFDEGQTWGAKTAYAYDKARGLITLSFTKGKTKYTLDLLYAAPGYLYGQMKRQSNPVTNKKTKKTTYTTECGAAVGGKT